jgi:hypothetical protein
MSTAWLVQHKEAQNEKHIKCCISNTLNLERFQSKALCLIVYAPWKVPNTVIRRDHQIPTVKE